LLLNNTLYNLKSVSLEKLYYALKMVLQGA
jgi:hypothetical protein